MPFFIIQGNYSHAAMKGMVAKPEDRAAPVAKLLESVGGRLVSYYMTFGDSDFHVTVEAPDERAMLAVLAAVGAGPGVRALSTTLAIPTNQAMQSFAKAKDIAADFKAAGAG
ncbi:GYD domain-containing protein [Humitalea sp. 24SJ18S-53]|uniref:GYD domain-containing protein n=1 Tax=Humitalea sp. 24SJ18S-53 TaxID=3422307 RepID=UPI003D67CA0F